MSYKIIEQDKEKSERWCIIDIDGVLNNYPNCWLQYIANKTKIETKIKTLQEAKQLLSYYNYKKLKAQYRTSGFKKQILPRKGAKEFLFSLRKLNYKIAIVTARDVNLSYEDTHIWLAKNNLIYDRLIFDNKKHGKAFEILPFAVFIVDDNTYICNIFSRFNIKTYLYQTAENKTYKAQNAIHKVSSFNQIIEDLEGEKCQKQK